MVRPIKEGKCCKCRVTKSLYARGLCTSCYTRDLRIRKKLAVGLDPAADGRGWVGGGKGATGNTDLDQLQHLTDRVVQGYMRVKAENDQLRKRNSDIKMKFIVDSHKAWLKKVRRVNVNMLRIVKAEPQETPEPRAEDLGSGPRELRLGVERP